MGTYAPFEEIERRHREVAELRGEVDRLRNASALQDPQKRFRAAIHVYVDFNASDEDGAEDAANGVVDDLSDFLSDSIMTEPGDTFQVYLEEVDQLP